VKIPRFFIGFVDCGELCISGCEFFEKGTVSIWAFSQDHVFLIFKVMLRFFDPTVIDE
jgi:hypothetical protein